jgi:hypothetical protein
MTECRLYGGTDLELMLVLMPALARAEVALFPRSLLQCGGTGFGVATDVAPLEYKL